MSDLASKNRTIAEYRRRYISDQKEIKKLQVTITELEGEAKEAFYDARDARITITEQADKLNRTNARNEEARLAIGILQAKVEELTIEMRKIAAAKTWLECIEISHAALKEKTDE